MIKTKAIVLNRIKFKESDFLVFLYTLDFGKMIITAKGANRSGSKLSAHLEPLNFVDLMIIKNKRGFSIGSSISKKSFVNIKNSYNSVYLAGRALNFFNKAVKDEQQDFDLFVFLKSFLEDLESNHWKIEEKSDEDLNFFLDIFKLKLLALLGYSFNLCSCVDCSSEAELNVLSFDKGGLICQKCVKDSLLNNSYIKVSDDLIFLKKLVNKSDFSSLFSLGFNKSLQDLIRKKLCYFSFS